LLQRIGTVCTKAVKASFGFGVGYEPQPLGRHFRDGTIHGYPLDLRAKTVSRSADAPQLLAPAALAQLALGWWERLLDDDKDAEGVFLRICDMLSARAASVKGQLVWPYTMPLPKYGIRPPWYSAMAQGQVASVFVRAHLLSGRDALRTIAEDAIEPLLTETSNYFVDVTNNGPILEEGPPGEGVPPARSHILNGWIYALWGLWDIRVGHGHDSAGKVFHASVDCLRKTLAQYDVGWWTRYDLMPMRVPHLAKPFYHRLHVNQTEMMYRMTGWSDFRSASRQWAAYDEPKRQTAAVAHKALYELMLATGR
jgi:hypothetical protein